MKRLLAFLLILTLCAPLYAIELDPIKLTYLNNDITLGDIRDGLVLDYDFKECSVHRVIDQSGHNNEGAVTAGKLAPDGMYFNGSTAYIDTGNTFQSEFRKNFTWSIWVKPDDGQPAALEVFGGVREALVKDHYALLFLPVSGKAAFSYQADGDKIDAETTNVIFPNGATLWTHLLMTVTQTTNANTTVRGYVNGRLAITKTAACVMSDFANAHPVFVGGYDNDGGLSLEFAGKINSPRLYDRVLTQEEISTLYLYQKQELGL